jgi:hypothetical protein
MSLHPDLWPALAAGVVIAAMIALGLGLSAYRRVRAYVVVLFHRNRNTKSGVRHHGA